TRWGGGAPPGMAGPATCGPSPSGSSGGTGTIGTATTGVGITAALPPLAGTLSQRQVTSSPAESSTVTDPPTASGPSADARSRRFAAHAQTTGSVPSWAASTIS